jgi:GTP-binding protein
MAIVGRPNVGKSALFNRIIRRRMSIVHEQSGVTRDRIATEITWDDERFELIDTGGLALMDGRTTADVIDDCIRKQVAVAVEDAAVVLLVVDLTAGIVPLDEEVARILHQRGVPVYVAANKADAPEQDALAEPFEVLGFPVYPVSALHNRGVGDLVDAAADKLPPPTESTAATALRIAVVGRPNVGKSSYINRLLNDERVIVSSVPGTTRDSVEIPFVVGKGPQARHYLLIDTAGMRRLGKIDNAVERFSLFRTESSIERADVVVMMLDAEQGPTSMDKKIANKIIQNSRGCVLMVNKWDLAMEENITQRKYGAALQATLQFMNFVPTIFLSAKTGYNIRNTIETIDYVAAQVRTQLGTGVLNRVLHDAFAAVQPPLVNGHRLKFYYATQTGTQPIRISLFVNNHKKITDNYRTYLIRELRKSFGLEGAPIVLRLRSRHGPRKP